MKNQEIYWLLKEKYHGEKSEAFFADCDRIEAGVPLAYVIGYVPFLDCTIHLDSHPLIPRPETEYWTEQAIMEIKTLCSRQDLEQVRGLASNLPPVRILDLCAGSGAIGVAVAKAIPEAFVTFAEIDPTHLPTIIKNLAHNTIIYDSIKYPIVSTDVFTNITGTFDFILTNPPYIDNAANTADESVVAYEPHLALFGGQDGLAIIEQIITKAPDFLCDHGQLWIEHEPFQSVAIGELAAAQSFACTTHKDQYDTARYSVLTRTVAI